MKKRTIIAILLAFTLTFGITAFWSEAMTNVLDGDTDTNVIEQNGAEAGKAKEKKKGNAVISALKTPLKAIGKLFGRGKSDDRVARLTEKDVEKFESAGVARVEDSRTEKTNKTPGASAREYLAEGRSLLLTGRINEAIAALSQAASLDPSLSEAHNLLGVAFDRKGMNERARESYERAVKAEPEDAQTLNNLGYSFYLNGNYRAAIDRLKRAAKLAPTDERILNNLALAQCRMGKYKDALKSFTRAGGEFMGRVNTATMLERSGRDSEAIEQYEAARRINSGSAVVLRRLADLYGRYGRDNEAQAARAALAGGGNSALAFWGN
ncbi:MAG TPA: tetratricopeptide repeat protein [Pyrinomonadaceae bacterium]|nr:tetratricopeptide repeat protein [Pyrinomonadaceae bacterium]